MKNRRFLLVIMDSSGRSIRRIGVARRSLEIAAGIVIACVVVMLGMTVHGLMRRDAATESLIIREENAEIADLLDRLDEQLPRLRHEARQSEATFAQLWSKSGLGVEPRLLGVGPYEGANGSRLPGMETPLASAVNGDLLIAEPIVLPLESERIHSDARVLEHSLAELLEYFHDAERILSHTPSVRPTRTPWLTSSYGRRRDPMHGGWVMHKGLDMGGGIGTPITAPADGVVIFTGRRGGYGQTVVIDHGYGLQTHFAHLSRYQVRRGQRVQRGDLIANMGSTGKSTGPHLHYEVRRGGHPMDPRRFILD